MRFELRFKRIRFALTAAIICTLAGCGGSNGGNDTAPAAVGAGTGGTGTGATGATAAPGVAIPTGLAPITLTAATPAATFAALAPTVAAVSVTIASPPRVTFSLTDAVGNAIIGLGSKSQSATATVATYPNLAFSLAKLIPGTGTAPSRWVTYIVTTVPTKNATTGAITASVPSKPVTDNTGTLVDNGNGTYTYTFFRDITKIKDQVAAAAETATNKNADLDDLTYDPTLVHRLTIQISGNAPGTGTNTPDAVQVTPGVPMSNPLNVIYDFIPATGAAVTASGRDIASTQKCNDCHQNLGGFPEVSPGDDARFHGGNRNKVEYCVVCHTNQLKYGHAEAVVDAKGNYDGKDTFKINGLSAAALPSHIHKIHMSEGLTKTGYKVGSIVYETACKFPQDVRNCTKCHDGSATSTAKTAQGDNWKNVPNRVACGACHDGINFLTGQGITLADANRVKAGLSTRDFAGHIGGAKANDSLCAECHTADTIAVNHIPVTPPSATNALLTVAQGGDPTNANTNAAAIASNRDRLPAGAIKVSYEIQSVSRNASKNPLMVFRMLQDGVAVPFNIFATAAVNPKTGQKEIWDNFMGAPSVYFVWAQKQDGIATPADFNASTSGYLRSLWNGLSSGAGSVKGTLTGPGSGGFYTATLTGVTVPDGAVMLTGGLGYSYSVFNTLPLTQTNLSDFPVTASTVAVGTGASPAPVADAGKLTPGMPNASGGLIVITPDAQLVASNGAGNGGTAGAYTARRPIIEDARCNKCHLELGTFTEDAFHAGQRNDGSTCSWCHNPNRTSSGWSADSAYFVHAIHAAAKRNQTGKDDPTLDFTWHASSTSDGFWKIGYPGILNNCETCHIPGTYDFSAPASAAAQPNRLYRTVATGILNSTVGTVTAGCTVTPINDCKATALSVFALSRDSNLVTDNIKDYGKGYSVSTAGVATEAATTTLVMSPIATVCYACHNATLAKSHMASNGASFYQPRSTALVVPEQCTLCHNPGRVADIKTMHAK